MHTSLNSTIPFELNEKTSPLSVLDSKQFMKISPLWHDQTTDSVAMLDPLVYTDESDIDSQHSNEQNAFEFHFEFGSKRPPTIVPEQSEDEQQPDVTKEALNTFQVITDNIYIGSATGRSMAQESMPCECKIESDFDNVDMACGLDQYCINRMMFMECIVEDCPSGRLCQNRRFQKHQYASVNVMMTEKKGYGLRALEDLVTNTFIMEYIGEVIPQYEFNRRTREYDAEGYKHYYFMTLKNDEIIDATKKGCLARFMNHSCNPNCVTQKWVIGKKMRIGIFTNRPIKAGEELTFDYKFERYGAMAQACFCNEPNCKGFIGVDEKKESEHDLTYDDALSSCSSSDDEYDYYEDDVIIHNNNENHDGNDTEELDEDDVDIIRTIHLPLQNADKVHSFVKRMLNSVGKPRLVNKLLMRLKATNPDNSRGRDILKTIIRLHGLKMLKFWLGEWKHNEMIVKKVLEVLDILPLANRNGLEECKMFDLVQRFVEHDNDQISQLSKKILQDWSQLKVIYRIPKRIHQVTDRPIPYLPSSCKYAENITTEFEKEDDEQDEKVIHTDCTQEEKELSSSLLAGKKRRYESTREWFDPDDDYFEYISMQPISPKDLEWKMSYPPQPHDNIPTAPRAMLEKQQKAIYCHHHHHYDTHQQHYKHYKYHKQNNALSFQQQQQQNEYPMYDYFYAYATNASTEYELPTHWGAAFTEDGSIYYYNTETGETQWEIPSSSSHDDNSIEVIQPSSLSTVENDSSSTKATVLHSSTTINESNIPTSTVLHSIEMRPTLSTASSASSSCISSFTSSPLSNSLSTPLTSTNSSVDTDDHYLNVIELKLQVGKVVTKYLNTMETSLWSDDKPLFKRLARKVTHYIVDKNVESGKKIKRVDSCERTKIEKYMDEFIPGYFSKL